MSKKLQTKRRHSSKYYAALALFGCLLLALTAQSTSPDSLLSWEGLIFFFIYGWTDWLRPLFLAVTQLGSPWMVLLAPLLALWRRRTQMAVNLATAGVLAVLVGEAIKYFIDRPRPAYLLIDVTVRDAWALGSGFPSIHTSIAVALGLTLLPFLKPSQAAWAWVAMIGVALSRLYLGVHAPLDIVGGFAVGILVSSLVHMWGLEAVRGAVRRLPKRRKLPI